MKKPNFENTLTVYVIRKNNYELVSWSTDIPETIPAGCFGNWETKRGFG